MTTVIPPNGEDPVAVQFREEFLRLCEENKAGFRELEGRGAQFDATHLVMGQIECLYETLGQVMGPVEGPRFVWLARLRWEQRIATEIAKAKEQGVKAQLSVGGSFTPAMIRQLAQATGTFGGLR